MIFINDKCVNIKSGLVFLCCCEHFQPLSDLVLDAQCKVNQEKKLLVFACKLFLASFS